MFVRKHLQWKSVSRFIQGYTLVRNLISAKNVVCTSPKRVAFLLTEKSIQETNLTHVLSVDWNLHALHTYRHTWYDIQVKRHLLVASVAVNLDEETLWWSTCESTQATNHFYVQYVVKVLHKARTLKFILQLIQKINHSCVYNVVNLSPTMLAWKITLLYILERDHLNVSFVPRSLWGENIWNITWMLYMERKKQTGDLRYVLFIPIQFSTW